MYSNFEEDEEICYLLTSKSDTDNDVSPPQALLIREEQLTGKLVSQVSLSEAVQAAAAADGNRVLIGDRVMRR